MTGNKGVLHFAAALILLLFIILTGLAAWRAPEIAAWRWYLQEGKPRLISAKLMLLPPLRWLDDYYVVADLGKNTFAIGEPRYGQCNFSYLMIGSARALLFDTGPGVRNIAPIVRQLTSLPVVALPSHLHFDHTGNLAQFADVALPDLPALRGQVHDGRFAFGLYQYLGFVEGFKRPQFHVSKWIAPGSKIDLGDRNLTVESLPGHTPDSVVLLDEAANRLFSGDFIYPSEIYAFLPGADLKTYAASARRLTRLVDAQTLIYGAHGCDRLPTVDVPTLNRADVVALTRALDLADTGAWAAGTGWYPRRIPVNERMELLAKYPWMRP